MKKVRVDKWLWSVRIFKSRSKASDACKTGKVKLNGKNLKASSLIIPGEIVEVKKDGFDLNFEILKLIDKRVSAPLAQECYKNLTPQEELDKYKNWFVGKGGTEMRERGAGRPTKKERRKIDDFKGDYLFLFDETDES